jgi:hypothetical protein
MRSTLFLLFVLAPLCPAGVLTMTPLPAAQATPGDFAGWGYTFYENDGWAVPTFSEFNPAPSSGLYLDFVPLADNFLVISPFFIGQGQNFDPLSQTGIGEFFIDPATAPGTIIDGTITLHYDLYRLSPNVDPNSFLSGDNTVSANVSILVSAPAASSPEPAAWLIVSSGLLLCLTRQRKKIRRGTNMGM